MDSFDRRIYVMNNYPFTNCIILDPPSSNTAKTETAYALPNAYPRSIEFELKSYTGIFCFLEIFLITSECGQLFANITSFTSSFFILAFVSLDPILTFPFFTVVFIVLPISIILFPLLFTPSLH